LLATSFSANSTSAFVTLLFNPTGIQCVVIFVLVIVLLLVLLLTSGCANHSLVVEAETVQNNSRRWCTALSTIWITSIGNYYKKYLTLSVLHGHFVFLTFSMGIARIFQAYYTVSQTKEATKLLALTF